MKKLLLYVSILLLILSGCKKLDELTQFDMEYIETVVIPSSLGINLPFNLYMPDIETDSESTFEVNNTRKDLLEQVILKEANLTLTSPVSGDFSFLESISIYMSADGLSEIKIAWKDNIPSDVGTYIKLDVTGNDLKEYIKEDIISLRINTVTDELLGVEHEIDVYTLFFVDAKVLGI